MPVNKYKTKKESLKNISNSIQNTQHNWKNTDRHIFTSWGGRDMVCLHSEDDSKHVAMCYYLMVMQFFSVSVDGLCNNKLK